MNLSVRKATKEDIRFVYALANDPSVRQNAFHTEAIPYEDHVKWYNKVLQDKNRILYIASKNGECVGTVRFDIEEGSATISYSICKEQRGKGYGTALIAASEKRLLEERADIDMFIAEVKYDNPASAKVFLKNGYEEEDKENCKVFVKKA